MTTKTIPKTKPPVATRKTAAAKPAAAQPAKSAPVPAVVVKSAVAEQPVAKAVAIETAAIQTNVETATDVAVKAPAAIKKEVTKMNDTIKNAAENAAGKGQAYLTDMTAKAKAAADKGTKAFEEMNDFTKGNVEALVESGKIAAKGLESMGQGYAEYTRKSFESTTAALKGFAAVKSPTDFFKLHSDFVRGQFDSMVAETSKNTEAMMKLVGEIAQPISNRVALAAEKIKIAA